jgi:hypothetical protein
MASSKPTRAPSEANSPPPSIRIGNFIADILVDPQDSNTYHWVVQRINSPSIIYWDNEKSFEEAESCAKQHIDELIQRDTVTP